MLDCERKYKRSKRFKPDQLLPKFTSLDKEYKNSEIDRGHQMAVYDRGYDSIEMIESIYYSNMTSQLSALSRGSWERLEEYTRKLVKIIR